MGDITHSYHEFMFPFLWNKEGNFLAILSQNPNWRSMDYSSYYNDKAIVGERDGIRKDYNISQFVFTPVQYAIFGKNGSDLLKRYLYNFNLEDDNRYVIHKNNKEYILTLKNIDLRIYNTGVGIITFRTENNEYSNIEDIKKINDYGRRISFPFINFSESIERDKLFKLTADKIYISISGVGTDNFAEDYGTTLSKWNEDDKELKRELKFCYIAKFIRRLMEYQKGGIDYRITTNETKDGLAEYQTKKISLTKKLYEKRRKTTEFFYMEPTNDDRMFTSCLMLDDDLSQRIKAYEDEEYSYIQSAGEKIKTGNLSNDIYSIIFIDPGESSCQNHKLLRKKLEEHVYARWVNYGTIHGVTSYSLICITAKDMDNWSSVMEPFLNIYTEMARLVLVQRASVINFSKRASAVSQNQNKKFNENSIIESKNLFSDYALFQNQLCFKELSVQDQGADIYSLLRKQLHIEELKLELEGQLKNLYEAMDLMVNHRRNNILFTFTVFSLMLIGVQILQSTIIGLQEKSRVFLNLFISIGILAILVPLVYYTYYIYKRKHK